MADTDRAHVGIFGSLQLESLYAGTYYTRNLLSPSYSAKAIEGFFTCYGTLNLEANLKDMGHDRFRWTWGFHQEAISAAPSVRRRGDVAC